MPLPRRVRPTFGFLMVLSVVTLGVHGQTMPNVDPPTAAVAVRVRVPSEVAIGAELTYRITVENSSRGTAHHVLLKTTLPKGVLFVRASPMAETETSSPTWKFGTLEPSQRREVMLVVKPTTEDDIDLCARVQFEHGQCVRTRINRPGVNVRRLGPSTALKNDYPTYTLEVTNTGQATAKGVVVEESLAAGLQFMDSKPPTKGDDPLVWELGDIAYGQTKRIEYSVILKEVGKHTFRTRIRADGVKLEKTATVEVGEPNLDVIVVGPRTRVIGRQARYTITVVNTGTASLTGVKLSDELTPEIVFLGSNGGRLDGDLVRWDLGTIAPGSKKTVSVDVRSSIAGTFKNVCTAVADRGLREQGKTITQFTPASSLAVEIDRDTASLAVGMETTFVARVVNTGKEKEEKVPLVVQLGEGLEVIEARGLGKPEAVGGRIHFGVIDVLLPGQEVTATVRVKAGRVGEWKIEAAAGAMKEEERITVGVKGG